MVADLPISNGYKSRSSFVYVGGCKLVLLCDYVNFKKPFYFLNQLSFNVMPPD